MNNQKVKDVKMYTVSNRNFHFIRFLIAIFLVAAFSVVGCNSIVRCKKKEERKPPIQTKFVFSGHVHTFFDKPIAGVAVDVNGEITKTDSKGFFKIFIDTEKNKKRPFILNIRKEGYGLVSKIYSKDVIQGIWKMTKGTVKVIDPTKDFTVEDKRIITGPDKPCIGSLTTRLKKNKNFDATLPKGIPEKVKKAIEFAYNCDTCNPGIMLSMKANTLVDSEGKPPKGKVSVTLTTVDIFDEDTMPGDFTVQGGGFMMPYGAGSVTITGDGKEYHPRKDASATLTIPINPAQLKYEKGKILKEIPLLVYNENEGLWEPVTGKDKIGIKGKLNDKGDAYFAEVKHFSTFNFDTVWGDQEAGCIQINCRDLHLPDDFRLLVTGNGITSDGSEITVNREKTIYNSPDKIHCIYNLPVTKDNEYYTLIATKDGEELGIWQTRIDEPVYDRGCSISELVGLAYDPASSTYTDCCDEAVILDRKRIQIVNSMNDYTDHNCEYTDGAGWSPAYIVTIRIGYYVDFLSHDTDCADGDCDDLAEFVKTAPADDGTINGTGIVELLMPDDECYYGTCDYRENNAVPASLADTDPNNDMKYGRINCDVTSNTSEPFYLDNDKYNGTDSITDNDSYYIYIRIGRLEDNICATADRCGKVFTYSGNTLSFGLGIGPNTFNTGITTPMSYNEYLGKLTITINQNTGNAVPEASCTYTDPVTGSTSESWFSGIQFVGD